MCDGASQAAAERDVSAAPSLFFVVQYIGGVDPLTVTVS